MASAGPLPGGRDGDPHPVRLRPDGPAGLCHQEAEDSCGELHTAEPALAQPVWERLAELPLELGPETLGASQARVLGRLPDHRRSVREKTHGTAHGGRSMSADEVAHRQRGCP
ncbi:hypothetical protein GCM10027072_46930 [Streptomyces bullii]